MIADHFRRENVQVVAGPVMRHRVLLNFNAEAEAITPNDVIQRLVEDLPGVDQE